MKRPRKTYTAAASLTLAVPDLTGCSASTAATTDAATGASEVVAADSAVSASTAAETHAQPDDGEYDTAGATTITLADAASTVSGAGAAVKGDVITITAAGTYLLSGELSDAQVVVNSPDEGKLELVLDGVDVASSSTSPVVVQAADEALVILAAGSANTLADSAASGADDEATDAPTATLFSMADLTIAGTGALQVTGSSNDGIGSKDGLVVLAGAISVQAEDDGIRGKDYLVVQGGTLEVNRRGRAEVRLRHRRGARSRPDRGRHGHRRRGLTGRRRGRRGRGRRRSTARRAVQGGRAGSRHRDRGRTLAVTASDDGFSATAHTVGGGGRKRRTALP
jgi:hypothetical protein